MTNQTYKVVYTVKESSGFRGPRKVEFVEAAMEGMAKQQVIKSYGGPLQCSVWRVQQVD